MFDCRFCPKSVDDVREASERDWIPGFFDVAANDGEAQAVCPTCRGLRLRWNETFGDYELPATP